MRIQVFISEFPSEDAPEGLRIRESLVNDGVSCTLRMVESKPEFFECLAAARKHLAAEKSLIPILHISGHGNPQAIGMRTWGVVWEEMIEVLVGINNTVEDRLILCMSSCKGLRAWKINLLHDSPAFSVLVGSEERITWEHSIEGFTAFYRALSKGKTVKQALDAMKSKSRCSSFMIVPGKKVRRMQNEVKQAGAKGLAELNSVRRRYGLDPIVCA